MRNIIYMNGKHMVAGLEENKGQDFIQGWELLMTEFEHRTWFPGISEVIKVAGMIVESGMGVTEHNTRPHTSYLLDG